MGNKSVDVNHLMTLTKSSVRKHVRAKLLTDCPDNINKVTNRMLTDSLIYLEGYVDAIKGDMQPPINKEEIDSFLLDKAYNYISSKLPK